MPKNIKLQGGDSVRIAQLSRRTKNKPVRESTRSRRANDNRLYGFITKKGGAFSMMSKEAKQNMLDAYANLERMSAAERARFYEENSLWLTRLFNYEETDDDGNVLDGQIVGKNQLGKKAAAFKRATEKKYNQTDLKSMRRWQSKPKRSKKISKPGKMKQPKLTVEQVDAQIADLERQLAELKKLKMTL